MLSGFPDPSEKVIGYRILQDGFSASKQIRQKIIIE